MYDIRRMQLDGNDADFLKNLKEDRQKAIKDRLEGRAIGKKLEPIIEQIYAEDNLPSPFKTIHDSIILDITDI